MPQINLSHLPLQALRCFEAAARHRSFKLAADELCLTPSAVSHQIKKLEEWIGNPLFTRLTRQVELTEIGRNLFEEVSAAFRRMENCLEDAARHARRQPLRLAISKLMQHVLKTDFIEGFEKKYPQYELEIVTVPNTMNVPHLEVLKQADVALLIGAGFWDRASIRPLLGLHISAFCPTSLAQHDFPLNDPRQLEEYRWLQNLEYPSAWPWFLGLLGLSGLQSKLGMSTYSDMLDLLKPDFKAEGVALLDTCIAPSVLGQGNWRRMIDIALPSALFCLVYPMEDVKPGTESLIKFFTEQAQRLGWPNSF